MKMMKILNPTILISSLASRLICAALLTALMLSTGCGKKSAPSASDNIDLTKATDIFAPPVKQSDLRTDPSRVIAKVNEKEITQAMLDQESSRLVQLQFRGLPPEQLQQNLPKIAKIALDKIIGQLLVRGELESTPIEITAAEEEEALAKITARLPEGQTLQDFLQTQNMPEDKFRAGLKTELQAVKLFEQHAGTPEEATEADATSFFESNPDKFIVPAKAVARHILLRTAVNDTAEVREAQLAKANETRNRILEGAAFSDVAKEVSEDEKSKPNGGLIGEVLKTGNNSPFETALFNQRLSEVGKPVETAFGYHIIQVDSRTEEKALTFQESKDRILQSLNNQKKQLAIQSYLKVLKDKASIVFP